MHATNISINEIVIRRGPAVTNCAPYRYMADASELGLRPGEWPPKLRTTLGNGHMLYLWSKGQDDERIYRQTGGCIELTIYND